MVSFQTARSYNISMAWFWNDLCEGAEKRSTGSWVEAAVVTGVFGACNFWEVLRPAFPDLPEVGVSVHEQEWHLVMRAKIIDGWLVLLYPFGVQKAWCQRQEQFHSKAYSGFAAIILLDTVLVVWFTPFTHVYASIARNPKNVKDKAILPKMNRMQPVWAGLQWPIFDDFSAICRCKEMTCPPSDVQFFFVWPVPCSRKMYIQLQTASQYSFSMFFPSFVPCLSQFIFRFKNKPWLWKPLVLYVRHTCCFWFWLGPGNSLELLACPKPLRLELGLKMPNCRLFGQTWLFKSLLIMEKIKKKTICA